MQSANHQTSSSTNKWTYWKTLNVAWDEHNTIATGILIIIALKSSYDGNKTGPERGKHVAMSAQLTIESNRALDGTECQPSNQFAHKAMGDQPPRRFAQNPRGIVPICGARVIPTPTAVGPSLVPEPGS